MKSERRLNEFSQIKYRRMQTNCELSEIYFHIALGWPFAFAALCCPTVLLLHPLLHLQTVFQCSNFPRFFFCFQSAVKPNYLLSTCGIRTQRTQIHFIEIFVQKFLNVTESTIESHQCRSIDDSLYYNHLPFSLPFYLSQRMEHTRL